MSCRPPSNSTYLVIGQDLFSIDEYVKSQYNHSLHRKSTTTTTTTNDANVSSSYATNGSGIVAINSISNFVPSAFMVYTDLATLRGLWEPSDYGSGVEYADGIVDMYYPTSSSRDDRRRRDGDGDGTGTIATRSPVGLQIGLWLDGADGCFSICSGKLDANIQRLSSYLERTRASKIFLRVGYEFDNPSFGYADDPEIYALAYRKIVHDVRNTLTSESRRRVLFVWHSWAAPMANDGLSLERFYPGDDVVDWIGVSLFQQAYAWSPYWSGAMSDVENVLDFALDHNKPTMIAESTPFGGIELKQASEDAMEYLATHDHENDDWERWYGRVIRLIDEYDVSMWCYINCDWESQPMWHGVGFGETRLSSNSHVMSRWYHAVTNSGLSNRRFLHAGSLEYCGDNHPLMEEVIEDDFDPFISYILVPFLVAAGAFFIPYYILGKRNVKSTKEERRPLLSNIDEMVRTPAKFLDTRKPLAVAAPP